MKPLILLPMPRHLELTGDTYELVPGRRIALVGAPAQQLLFTGQRLRSALLDQTCIGWTLTTTTLGAPDEIGAILFVDPARVSHPEGYELDITANGIRITAGSPHGLFNAVNTLVQVLAYAGPHSNAPTVPCLYIRDYPDFPNRGVMLDISRDKVPTMETLYSLVDMLAGWKINQLQLYTEHTFAYRNHRAVWENASPMTEEEILELDRFCRDRFVSLVPNQNSFGHMSRWLDLPQYRHLAECPAAREERWWGSGPFSLNPTDPRTLDFLCGLYDELLPNFSARQFNVGCDEVFDLGEGRSKEICGQKTAGRVYLDFILQVYREVKARGFDMMFWGDIIIQHPELIPELPRDLIALEWGYEADHPFDEDAGKFASAGIPFYVCPGTSSWNSLAGRSDNAIGNILNAAENGIKHGAIGLLNTDWGDRGHWQALPVSFLGFAFGAGAAWCLETNRGMDVSSALDRFAFQDDAGIMGRVAYDLGNTYKALEFECMNSTPLFHLLQTPVAQIPGTTPVSRDNLRCAEEAIEHAIAPLGQASMARPDAELILEEYQLNARLLQHAVRRGMLALDDNPPLIRESKQELAVDLRAIRMLYRKVWHARNRPGGFRESVARLDKLSLDYRTD